MPLSIGLLSRSRCCLTVSLLCHPSLITLRCPLCADLRLWLPAWQIFSFSSRPSPKALEVLRKPQSSGRNSMCKTGFRRVRVAQVQTHPLSIHSRVHQHGGIQDSLGKFCCSEWSVPAPVLKMPLPHFAVHD